MGMISTVTLPDGSLHEIGRSVGAEYVRGTWTAATNAWTGVSKDSQLYDGKEIVLYLPFAGNNSYTTLNLTLNGGTGPLTGAKNVYFNSTTRHTTHYGQYQMVRMVYHASHNIAGTNYEGWWMDYARDTNDTAHNTYYYYSSIKAHSIIYRYQVCVQIQDGSLLPIASVDNKYNDTAKVLTTESFLPTGLITYYNSSGNTAAGAVVQAGRLYDSGLWDLRYSFNEGSTLTANTPVYMVTLPQGDGLVKLDADPIAQALPSTDDGKLYIYLGGAYDTYRIHAYRGVHPVFWYKNGGIRPYPETGVHLTSPGATNQLLQSNGSAEPEWSDSIYIDSMNTGSLIVRGNSSFVSPINGDISGNAATASSVAWGDVTGKPSTFAPSSHTHDDRYYTETEIDTKLSGVATSGHTHAAGDIVSGKLPVNRGGTGLDTLTSGQVLVGNGTDAVTLRPIDTTSGGTNNSTSLITSGAVYSGLAGKAASGHNHDSTYLKLSGGTLTGALTLKADQYWEYNSGKVYGINANNSDVYGVNAIYFKDDSTTVGEGINFYRDATHWDSLRATGGKLQFNPNRTNEAAGTWYDIYHTNNKPSKADVGLGNVENKSSATIRSELTSSNVTEALGYTPADSDAYLPLTGGELTGNLSFSQSNTTLREIRWKIGGSDYARIAGGATASNSGYLELATADDVNEPIYIRQYTGAFATLKRTATLLDSSGNTSFPGTLSVTGAITSNSTVTATRFDGNIYTNYVVLQDHQRGTSDIAMFPVVDRVRANRLAFLPADQIIIENTVDGGETWTDAGYSDAQKAAIFATSGTINIPRLNNAKSELCGVRITITGMKYDVPADTAETEKYNYWNSSYVKSTERYFQFERAWFWVSANNDTIGVTVQSASGANPNSWTTRFDNSNFTMTGWSGADWVKLSSQTFGGGTTQTGNHWNWRFTFYSRMADRKTAFQSTTVQSISVIKGYGASVWNYQNQLMYHDHIYSYDASQNVTFPANITTTGTIQSEKLIVKGTTVGTNTYADTNPKIAFMANDGQHGSLTWTSYDSIQSHASLTLNGTQGNEYFIAPNIKATGSFYGALSGNATSATESQKLARQTKITTTDAMDAFNEASKLKWTTFKFDTDPGFAMGSNDGMLISVPWENANYGMQIAMDDNYNRIAIRTKNSSSGWRAWSTLIHSDNYTTYAVPKTRKVNNKELSADISLTASDVGAATSGHNHDSVYVPQTRKVNNKALSADISLTASDVGASASGHTHDDRYYTESEIDSNLSNVIRQYSRTDIGTTVNIDNPGKSGFFELRGNNEVTYTGTLPAAGYMPILSLNNNVVAMQLAGNTGSNKFYIRGKQASNVTLSGVAWAELYTTLNKPTKSDVGLGNVENKSSATIRGELTSSNVTTALGYTPADANAYLPLVGGEITGDVTLKTSGSGATPGLIFQRGTLTDSYNDWKIYDSGGLLYFGQRGSGSSTFDTTIYMDTSGGVHATKFTGELAGNATSSSYLKIVATNEIRFDVSTKPASATTIHIGYAWSDGSKDAKINRYLFQNGNAAKAEVEASTFIGALTGHASEDLPLAGGQMTGNITWKDSDALPQFSGAPTYLLGIEAFASGGATKWASATAVKVGEATKATQDGSGNTITSTYKTVASLKSKGGQYQPIYFDSSGNAQNTTYTLNKSVPSDAVFTDTKNTAGSTNSDSKLFLIGATSQAANPQTYSDAGTYVTNGALRTGSLNLVDSVTLAYNATQNCLQFNFA